MEKRLRQLFDYQDFQGNPRLFSLISDTEKRYGTELTDEDIFLVSAAGDNMLSAAENARREKSNV